MSHGVSSGICRCQYCDTGLRRTASLMGISLEAMVINDMLGAILRSSAKIDVSAETLRSGDW